MVMRNVAVRSKPSAGTLLCMAALWGFINVGAAQAGTPCEKMSIRRLAADAPFAMTVTSATERELKSSTAKYCDVRGYIETHENTAKFEAWLPSGWNGKYVQYGCGGFCGVVRLLNRYQESNALEALKSGYAVAATDDGHESKLGFDGSWAVGANGMDRLLDFAYRAAHALSVSMKQLIGRYYTRGIHDAYFNGCSDGGREALNEAERFPRDFSGIIAGDPYLGSQYAVQHLKAEFAVLKSSKSAYLSKSVIAVVDRAVYESCDGIDGVKDGLIQNPLMCSFRPQSLLCGTNGNVAPRCLTISQVNALNTYLRPVLNQEGRVFILGQPVSDLETTGSHDLAPQNWFYASRPKRLDAPEPWGTFEDAPKGWQFPDGTMKYFVFRDSSYDTLQFPMTSRGVVADSALRLVIQSNVINAEHPHELVSYVRSGGKLLMYDGLSDGVLSPYPTMKMFVKMAKNSGGFAELSSGARLFEVPGMHHCGGGPGPNTFDVLTALDRWVTESKAPTTIIASHHAGNVPSGPVDRTMPLCSFPTEATYVKGPVENASSWRCAPNTGMLRVGYDGRLAGIGDDKR